MKKTILTVFITLTMIFSCMLAVQAQDDAISVYVNETELICDVAPYIENDRTMVPMRAIFEALDAVVEWEDATQTITANKYGKEIVLQIGNQTMTVNGNAQTLDVAPVIINSRTFVPLRAVSQALNASVEWFNFAKRAYINSANTYEMDVFVMGTIYAGFNYTKDFSSDIAPDTNICSHGTVTGVLSTNGYVYAIADNLYSPNEKIMISICADDMTDYNLISKLLSGKTISFAGTYTSCDETGDVHSMNLSHIGILQPDDIIFLDYNELIYPDVSNLEEKLKAEAKVTIYSPYSAPSVVFGSEVQYYLSQGWYLEPVTIIYDYYGNKSVIYEYELEYYLSQGWTTEPVVIIYDYQGNPSRVLQSEVPYYVSQGWSTVPAGQYAVTNTIKAYFLTDNNTTISQSYIEEIKRHTGTELQIVEPRSDSIQNHVAILIITTGEKIHWVNLIYDQPYKDYGRYGFLNNLTPYIEKYKNELPNIYSIVNDPKFAYIKGSNSEIYGIPATDYVSTYLKKDNGVPLLKVIPSAITNEAEIYATLKTMEWAHTKDASLIFN